jgi:outer membrane protein OmpA-like peptidoglycan-associated protein
MSQEADAIKPDFASAATTLRDTVKWLAAAFAATAALIIGSSPLTGLGKLALFSGRWLLAIALLLAGFVLICLALWRALRILKPDVLYRSSLLGTHDRLLDKDEIKELTNLRKDIDAHGADLLPPKYPTLKQLADNLALIERQLSELRATPSSVADPVLRAKSIEDGMKARAGNWAAIAKVLPLAQYLRLHRRFDQEQRWMALLSVLALVSLLGFAVASTVPDKKEDPVDHPITIHNHCGNTCGTPAPDLPRLPAVLFDNDKASVSTEGLATIQRARDVLRANPRTLLLVQAHTDTVASRGHNEGLAHRRALAVLGLLSSQGGVAPERLLVSYLPETALPRVTPDQTPRAENRSVELVWLEDTRR